MAEVLSSSSLPSSSSSDTHNHHDHHHHHDTNHPKQLSYLLIENPSKSNNLGPILRCATAFAIHQVIFVGYEKCSVKGSHGSSKYVNIKAFVNFEQAVTYLKQSCNVVSIIGILGDVSCLGASDGGASGAGGAIVEEDEEYNAVKVTSTGSYLSNSSSNSSNEDIKNTNDSVSSPPSKVYPFSHPVHKRPFPSEGNVCFSINRRSIGLPIHQATYCDSFIHVQTSLPSLPLSTSITASTADSTSNSNNSTNSTNSNNSNNSNINNNNNNKKGTRSSSHLVYGLLDSQTCLSITLHHFNGHAGYNERMFEGQKFHVEKSQMKGQMHFDKDGEEVRRMRLERKEQLQRESMEMDEAMRIE